MEGWFEVYRRIGGVRHPLDVAVQRYAFIGAHPGPGFIGWVEDAFNIIMDVTTLGASKLFRDIVGWKDYDKLVGGHADEEMAKEIFKGMDHSYLSRELFEFPRHSYTSAEARSLDPHFDEFLLTKTFEMLPYFTAYLASKGNMSLSTRFMGIAFAQMAALEYVSAHPDAPLNPLEVFDDIVVEFHGTSESDLKHYSCQFPVFPNGAALLDPTLQQFDYIHGCSIDPTSLKPGPLYFLAGAGDSSDYGAFWGGGDVAVACWLVMNVSPASISRATRPVFGEMNLDFLEKWVGQLEHVDLASLRPEQRQMVRSLRAATSRVELPAEGIRSRIPPKTSEFIRRVRELPPT